jgi:hypothetical protein
VETCGGSVSFKFKLCQEVRKIGEEEVHQVIALLLHGFVKIRSMKNHRAVIVKEDSLEEVNRAG